ncbi:aminotransferase class III-fold pyridoxal phosphate-dependent enzyme, partial [Escherichia coli]|uniref:aminotransferase class III-fold pyridoxal phosphate-dependent enzyme n=2 Tax=Pseudomonadota TaxID=1224 RepID=UPI001EDB2824
IPLVADEVICGFGRTGHLWGAQAVGLRPDIIVASKSMSAGYFPMGAVMLSADMDKRATAACERWEEFPHGYTTGGHPV